MDRSKNSDRSRRPALAAAAALALATAAIPALAAAPASASASVRPAATTPVLGISQSKLGTTLTNADSGLSYEAYYLTMPGFTAGNLAAYMKTLGTSVVRVGGNTVDQTFWTSTGQTPPSWSLGTITPADLTGLAKLAKASGWKVIL